MIFLQIARRSAELPVHNQPRRLGKRRETALSGRWSENTPASSERFRIFDAKSKCAIGSQIGAHVVELAHLRLARAFPRVDRLVRHDPSPSRLVLAGCRGVVGLSPPRAPASRVSCAGVSA